MKNRKHILLFFGVLAGLVIFVELVALRAGNGVETAAHLDRRPAIDPDYSDIVIPPNIAPLNFLVKESGEAFSVRIQAPSGKQIEIISKSPKIDIPIKKWRRLLTDHRGQDIEFHVFVKDGNGRWQGFRPITNRIADDPIDGYLVYRRSEPIYVQSKSMGIYQRNLADFGEKTLLHHNTLKACVNCHSFPQNNPDNMLVHVRYGPAAGTLVAQEDKIVKVDTRTNFNKSPGAYRSWHPNGHLVAFSVNVVRQFFHAVGETREAFDMGSDLVLYDIDKNMITSSPQISRVERMETYPEWSPDGKYLYFCGAAAIDHTRDIKDVYESIFYDLMRISYDEGTGTWGESEIVLSSSKTGKSIAHPKFSPDGKYLLFCMQDYGTFTLFRPGGDLYLMEMETGNVRSLDINSDQPESYHSWSSNGRWFVFSSKRRNGICTLNYFSHIDEAGNVSKPFLLPQKDPTLHEHEFWTYNVPELIIKAVPFRPQQLYETALDNDRMVKAEFDPSLEIREVTGASPKPTIQPAIQ